VAKPNRIKELEKEFGEPATVVIPRAVKESGSVADACVKLNLSNTALYYWAKRNGYITRRRWVVELVKETA